MYGKEVVALFESMIVTFVESIVPKLMCKMILLLKCWNVSKTRVVEKGNPEDNLIKVYRRILVDEITTMKGLNGSVDKNKRFDHYNLPCNRNVFSTWEYHTRTKKDTVLHLLNQNRINVTYCLPMSINAVDKLLLAFQRVVDISVLAKMKNTISINRMKLTLSVETRPLT